MTLRRAHRRVLRTLAVGLVGMAAGAVVACGNAGADGASGAAGTPTGSGAPVAPRADAESENQANLAQPERAQAERAQAGLAPCPSGDRQTSPRATGLPDVTLSCLGPGDDVRLAQVRGTPMVVNVWATWCAPCREEVPHFQALHERSGERLIVLGVDYEESEPARALAFAEEVGLQYAQVADPQGQLGGPLGLQVGIPATVFVNAEGHIVHTAHKPYRSFGELVRDVGTYLKVDL